MCAGLGPRLADALAKAGPVAAVIASIAAVTLLDLHDAGVRIVGDIPRGLPPLTLPAFDLDLWQRLLPAAALIGLVGFVESVSVAETLAAKRRQRIDANQELVGLGAANLGAAFTGGYPVTGGFSRSVVNYAAGAETPMAGVITAGLIALTVAFLTPLFFHLPNAVLAATIIVAVLSLVDLGAIRRTWRYSKADFAAMAATIVLVLAVGVEAGIVAGVLLSVVLFLWRTTRPHMAIVGRVPGTEHFRNIERHAVIRSETVLIIRVDESLYFANQPLSGTADPRRRRRPAEDHRRGADVHGRELHRRQRPGKPGGHRRPPEERRCPAASLRGEGPGHRPPETLRFPPPPHRPDLPQPIRGHVQPGSEVDPSGSGTGRGTRP